jgi:hypothetical protein
MDAVQKLRLWINDTDTGSEIFTDKQLAEILSWHDDEDSEEAMLDLARADCLEMISTDIRRWNSYTIGGQSETLTSSKSELLANARRIRARWGFKGGRL